MEITRNSYGQVIELVLEGQLDAVWDEHLETAISEVVRDGYRRVALNMAGVDFLSSAGIRVLLKFHKQLSTIDGRLWIIRPSEMVSEVLGTMGLGARLISDEPIEKGQPDLTKTVSIEKYRVETERAAFDVRPAAAGGLVVCRVVGRPLSMTDGPPVGASPCSVSFPSGVFALGIGAPGQGLDDCRDRLGDFLAVDGNVAFLPTGQASAPDYLVAQGDFVPQLQVLHGLVCEGMLGTTVTFESQSGGAVTMSDIVEQCRGPAGGDAMAIVMAAESRGLVGATLRKSPLVKPEEQNPFEFPRIRDWMLFTPERAFSTEVVLVAGVATWNDDPKLAASLRPIGREGSPLGHFHAAVFSYSPLRKRGITLSETVQNLFERESLRGLLHLLHDPRPVVGAGQSEFVRGTCWVAPIGQVEVEA